MRLEERKLCKVEVFNDGNSWSMQWEGQNFVFRGTTAEFAKILRKIKAADDHQDPKSNRSMTYIKIAQEIASGHDRYIWVWKDLMKKLREDKVEESKFVPKVDDVWAVLERFSDGDKFIRNKDVYEPEAEEVAFGNYNSYEDFIDAVKEMFIIEEKTMRKEKREQGQIIELTEAVRLPGTDIILEAGERIRVLTEAGKSYWANKGQYQKEYEALYDELVPSSGGAGNVAGEVLRAMSKMYYRTYNDGDTDFTSYDYYKYLKDAFDRIPEFSTAYDLLTKLTPYKYDEVLDLLTDEVVEVIMDNPELKKAPERDYQDRYESDPEEDTYMSYGPYGDDEDDY